MSGNGGARSDKKDKKDNKTTQGPGDIRDMTRSQPVPVPTPKIVTRNATSADSAAGPASTPANQFQKGPMGGARGGRQGYRATQEAAEAAAKNASLDVPMGDGSTSNASRGSQRGRGNAFRGSRGGIRRHGTQGRSAFAAASVASAQIDYAALIAKHFDGTRRAGDLPHTEGSKFKKWAQQDRTVLAIPQPSSGSNIKQQLFGTALRLPMTMSYNVFSQNPSINLHIRDGQDAAYFPINVEMLDKNPADDKRIVTRVKISGDELDPVRLDKKVKEVGCTVDMYMLQDMIKMGNKAKDPKAKGLELMSIALPAGFNLWLKRCSSKSAPDNSDNFIRQVNASRRLLIVRENWYPQQHLDPYFDSLAARCVDSIYPFYRSMTKPENGSQFKDFIGKDSKGKLEHMQWMGNPLDMNAYTYFNPLGWFTSFKEYETVLSAEVIYDRETEKEVFNRIFSLTNQHEIRAFQRRDNHWVFHVRMSKGDEKNVPSISPGTSLTMTQVHVPAEFKIVPAKHGVESIMQIDKSTPTTLFPSHKGKVIDCPTEADFAFSCMIPDNTVDDFVNLAERKAIFSIELNRIPSDRQLEAIAGLATLDPESNLGKLLLAKDFTNLKERASLIEEYWSKLLANIQAALQNYERASECNVEQQKAVDLAFQGKTGITIVQGPPGTGKSTTVAFVAVKAAAMGAKVSVTAPANVPTRSLAAAVIMESQHYHAHLAESQGFTDGRLAADSFKMVFVPTRAQSGRELFDLLNFDAEESLEADDLLKKYSLASHLHDLAKKKSANGNADATAWLQTRAKLAKKEVLTQADKATWRKTALDWAPEVFRDPAVKIVMSTCNNHANEVLADWLPDVNIIDEAAFATEPDVLVPLNKAKLSAKMTALVGDHLQLTPVMPSFGQQVWGRQGKLSLFKRILDQLPQVPFVMLKENYRMHPEISEFPGLGYNGLLCNPLTQDEEALMWKAWKSFMQSVNIDKSRRIDSVFFDKANCETPSYRRMFFNTGGASGPKPGGNSLQNFANINWIVDLLNGFAKHMEDNNFEFVEEGLIIQVPYVAEKNELLRQIYLRCSEKVAKWVIVKTIDSNQGGQSPLSWLSLTPANPHHGSKIGFTDDWNRVTVALTRGKSSLCCFGNIDSWLSEFEVFWGKDKLENWALFMTDLLVKGSVYDLEKMSTAQTFALYRTYLPAHSGEIKRNSWTKQQPAAPAVKLHKEAQDTMSKSDADSVLKAKREAITKLAQLKAKANAALEEVRQARVPSSNMDTS
ncbi:hypothetical protein L207DRAFT_636183 [Hyaloscypha variabilis F]|uniref:P-loop containing nucleoside triphosphate hydrolase protein n=1 Tax=Hyaloscypha variabilis (strain UAMH 11265 / GT02V1 / F) TaxID=1149755 RepID=A0A2J6RG48_HYAVF|nr:hypothetical protein L207DRAFT_636183 [Hyaloscypha variabilis F]